MELRYRILSAIYELVKDHNAPATYLCTMEDIRLLQPVDKTCIEEQLKMLASESFITISRHTKIVLSITSRGIAKTKALEAFFGNKNFYVFNPTRAALNYQVR
jgi:hypothetical protein